MTKREIDRAIRRGEPLAVNSGSQYGRVLQADWNSKAKVWECVALTERDGKIVKYNATSFQFFKLVHGAFEGEIFPASHDDLLALEVPSIYLLEAMRNGLKDAWLYFVDSPDIQYLWQNSCWWLEFECDGRSKGKPFNWFCLQEIKLDSNWRNSGLRTVIEEIIDSDDLYPAKAAPEGPRTIDSDFVPSMFGGDDLEAYSSNIGKLEAVSANGGEE